MIKLENFNDVEGKKLTFHHFFKLKFQLAFQKDCNNMHFST